MNECRLLLFELGDPVGHQLGYIQHLIDYWLANGVAGGLDIVVTPAWLDLHVEFVASCSRYHCRGIRLHSISSVDGRRLERWRGSLLLWSLVQGRILAKSLDEFVPDDCLLMSFDHLQPSLSLGLQARHPVRLHGLYFRPMLDRSVYGKGNTRAELIWRKSLLKRSLRNPSLRTLFCLDPWSIPYIEKLTSRVSVIALPDPVREYSERADPVHLRRRLGVETGRKLMLFFGELSRRKGTFQLLESLRLLSPADAKRLTVLMAGPIPAADRSLIRSRANRLKNVNICQLIIEDRFVPDHEIQNLFNASDLVIAPYQHHIGMSAVLVRAAMARKPIIGPNHGVLAALIRGQRLGLAVDTSSPVKIANAIGYCLSRPSEELFDRASAIAFAEFNRPEKFTATIFGRLFDGSEGISSMSGNTRTASQCAFFT